MTWLRKWWKRHTNGADARAAGEQARRQQMQAECLAGRIDQVAKQVEAAAVRTDRLAREVNRALGAR